MLNQFNLNFNLSQNLRYSFFPRPHFIYENATILKDQEEISKIKKAYFDKFHDNQKEGTYYNYGLDLEFKIYGEERQLYIKQIRPFQN